MTWHTSNGSFQTKGEGSIQLKFFVYSNSKWIKIKPDVVEYNGVKMKKPLFDLILGTRTMRDFGIILNFQKPMQSIEEMPASRKKALKLTNSLANSKEPKSTEEATERVVQILDANYKKADLKAVVKGLLT